jgi:hypothetical protein
LENAHNNGYNKSMTVNIEYRSPLLVSGVVKQHGLDADGKIAAYFPHAAGT